MSIRYSTIQKSPRIFERLFGFTVEPFSILLKKVELQWKASITSSYKRPGRDYKLSIAYMMLMLLLYYRSDSNQIFLGYLFGLDDSRVCRIIKQLEPIVANVTPIAKQKKLSQEGNRKPHD